MQKGVVKLREVATRKEIEVPRAKLFEELRKRLQPLYTNGST